MNEYAHGDYLIEPDALLDRLGDTSLRVFDATVFLRPAETGYTAESGESVYSESHVPGAAFLDQIKGLSDTTTGFGFSLPSVDALAEGLRSAGVSNEHQIVVYSTSHMMWATRAWWLLHYAGHERVAVLNGGYGAWQEAGYAVESGTNRYPAGAFQAKPRSERFVDRNLVLEAISDDGTCTVNALSPGVYTGEAEMSYGRKGHITGSVNLYYDELLDHGRFLSADALEANLRDKGMLDAPRVIAYCGGGISATIDAFACLLVGKEEIAVYDGSMSEWVADPELPMTEGSHPG